MATSLWGDNGVWASRPPSGNTSKFVMYNYFTGGKRRIFLYRGLIQPAKNILQKYVLKNQNNEN